MSFKGNKVLTCLVFRLIAPSKQSVVKRWNLLRKCFVFIFLVSQNGKSINIKIKDFGISYRKNLVKFHYLSFKRKNKKLPNLIRLKKQVVIKHYSLPIINIYKYVLSNKEQQQLELGLKHKFVDKNKNLKSLLAANMERLTERVENYLDNDQVQNFHAFMRAYTEIFTKNIFAIKDYTYRNLQDMVRDKDLVLLNGDKDSQVVVMNRIDYNNTMQKIIDDGIKSKIYEETADHTFKDLKNFQEFLYRNFKDYGNYDDIRPVSNQLAKLYGTAEIHNFGNLKDITSQNLKCYQLKDQMGTFTYTAAKVISNYLKPLC